MAPISLSPLIALVALASTAQGQTPIPIPPEEIWLPLLSSPGDSIDLRYQLELVPKVGWQVQFKNFSSQPLHFGFYLANIQTSDHVAGNGRFHIIPGKTAAPFTPWVGNPPPSSPRVILVNIRVGQDEGPFLQE